MQRFLSYILIGTLVVSLVMIIFNLRAVQESLSNNKVKTTEKTSNTGVSLKKQSMKLTSQAFPHNGKIPMKYTCDGENVNPPLSISEVPEEAQSLALIVEDPDAPGKTWVHWVIYNIARDTKEIQENTVPKFADEGLTDFGKPGYGGPCPPSGTHRYVFTLYALDTGLTLGGTPNKDTVVDFMEGHVIAKAELIGRYSKL
jgi:Raf kinase inhibitor-like YbhB/YbcL family protein